MSPGFSIDGRMEMRSLGNFIGNEEAKTNQSSNEAETERGRARQPQQEKVWPTLLASYLMFFYHRSTGHHGLTKRTVGSRRIRNTISKIPICRWNEMKRSLRMNRGRVLKSLISLTEPYIVLRKA